MAHKDPEARRKYQREYKERNKERLRQYRREAYRRENPPKTNDAWSVGHSDMRYCRSCGGNADTKPQLGCKEKRHAESWDRKRERNNAYRRERRAAARATGTVDRSGRGNPDNKRAYARRRHIELRNRLFSRLNQYSCVQCGFDDSRALQFDHIHSDGAAHRRSLASGTAYFAALDKMLLEELRNRFQVLCANCNTIKREELEEWRVKHAEEDSKKKK